MGLGLEEDIGDALGFEDVRRILATMPTVQANDEHAAGIVTDSLNDGVSAIAPRRIEITEEMVERGAEAYMKASNVGSSARISYDALPENAQTDLRTWMRAALEAALNDG